MKQPKRNQGGFVIVAALILSGLVAAGFLASLVFKVLIDDETRRSSLRHTSFILEDNIRTYISVESRRPLDKSGGLTPLQAATVRRQSIINYLNTLARDPTGGGTNPNFFKLPIPGSNCGANPCHVYVRNLKFKNDTWVPDPAAPSDPNRGDWADATATAATKIGVYVYSETPSGVDKGAGYERFIIPLPSVGRIQTESEITLGNLICPASAPRFMGTEIKKNGSDYKLEAICRPLTLGQNASEKCAGTNCATNTVTCNIDQGYWLTGFNLNAGPECKRFPAGIGHSQTVVDLCPEGKVADSLALTNTFQISAACRDKGGPYDFQK